MSDRELQEMRVLIVDDNREAAEMLQMLLEMNGYSVQVAHSGEEGLACNAAFRPQVIFSDINMPAMSGFEFGSRLRMQASQPPPLLVAITGTADDISLDLASAGFDQRLTKPCSFEEILAPIEAFFALSAQP